MASKRCTAAAISASICSSRRSSKRFFFWRYWLKRVRGSFCSQALTSSSERYLVGSSAVVWTPRRYVTHSMRVGPPPPRARLLSQRPRVGLLLERHRDGPLVVLADEDDRHVPDAGDVQGLVEVALGGGTVAEEDHDDGVVAPVLGGVGEADGVGDLGRHGDGDRQVVLVGGDRKSVV